MTLIALGIGFILSFLGLIAWGVLRHDQFRREVQVLNESLLTLDGRCEVLSRELRHRDQVIQQLENRVQEIKRDSDEILDQLDQLSRHLSQVSQDQVRTGASMTPARFQSAQVTEIIQRIRAGEERASVARSTGVKLGEIELIMGLAQFMETSS